MTTRARDTADIVEDAVATYATQSALTSGLGSKLDVAGGKILQVVSVTKTDTFTINSQTFTDVTGLTATITPSSTSNKILVMVQAGISHDPARTGLQVRLVRGATAIYIGDADGNRTRASMGRIIESTANVFPLALTHLDSPNTAGVVTYALQMRSDFQVDPVYVNRNFSDPNVANEAARGASSITLMEVSA